MDNDYPQRHSKGNQCYCCANPIGNRESPFGMNVNLVCTFGNLPFDGLVVFNACAAQCILHVSPEVSFELPATR